MLQIKDINKKYVTGDLVQTALDGVSLSLRDNEFVAILGPSGSGKTTLLNVIGGLDRYDSGDLIINGISTKKYTDRDWDSYRNHTVGFVFQSYNLIPHQTVLANVALALTISGISGAERKKRAIKALEDVGLGNQLHKKPNQMSGGQMQRVAIARALVNDPDILLADEPTGALDSETSIQVMDLLKEVSKNRLVVMVTHNPELAEQYANRIVRVKDGRITDDTNPFCPDLSAQEPPKHRNLGKASMSFFTALALSFNNLWTKKARTLLTAFAGSIGIIGIALILSLSTGFKLYIDKIQEDTLSNYPLMLQSTTASMSPAMMGFFPGENTEDGEANRIVTEHKTVAGMFSQFGSNDLGAFKKYMTAHYDEIGDAITEIKYDYGVKPRIYVGNTENGIIQSNPSTVFDKVMGDSMMSAFMITDVYQEMMDNRELLQSQYRVVEGRWPEAYNELVVVLERSSRITDYTAYSLGMKDVNILNDMVDRIMKGQEIVNDDTTLRWSYDDLFNLDLRLVPVSSLYRHNEEYGIWEDMSGNESFMKQRIAEGEPLHIVGLIIAKDDTSTLMPGIAYTSDLTRHVMEQAKGSEIVKMQLKDPSRNVFTGVPFDEENKPDIAFEDMIQVDGNAITSAFGTNISSDAMMNFLKQKLNEAMGSIHVDNGPAQQDFLAVFGTLAKQMLNDHIAENGGGAVRLQLDGADDMAEKFLAGEDAQAQILQLAEKYQLPAETFTLVYKPLLVGLVAEHINRNLGALLPENPEPTEPSGPAEPEEPVPPADPVLPTLPPDLELPTLPPDLELPTLPPDLELPTLPPDLELPTLPPDLELPTLPPDLELPTLPPELIPALPPARSSSPAPAARETPTLPPVQLPELDPALFSAELRPEQVEPLVEEYLKNPMVVGTAGAISLKMMEGAVRSLIVQQMSGIARSLMGYIGSSMTVDEAKLASAFQFTMEEEDLRRLMDTLYATNSDRTAVSNLCMLGAGDMDQPMTMSFYLKDFESKENFIDFLDGYNAKMEEDGKENLVIRYTDYTGMMMSSVKIIIDSISYALIAFVAVSLVVSSIMIGIITYISVMERTKEIGVLRAIGASKHNISQVFNAETFIIGLCSGVIGIGITLLLLIPGNQLIYSLTNNPDIVAQLPVSSGFILIILSMLLTLLGGLIPSRQAAKKDPVIALRSE